MPEQAIRSIPTSHWLAQKGDFNTDGIVDAIDFNIWNDHTFQSCTGWAAADFNGDGVDECPLNAVCLTLGIVGKSRAITGAGQAEE